ncbi:Mn2+/Fe2+ NRAMP family transporter [Lewinella aquimaris]|uniref:Mn2+/Fe2+ NRAMP family transporter n=1 Tax=Neolewinella aquimaris TaxID=1835722 RepID=A0A840E0M0_9BACT|nr:Mn2+/Fe2+ NRAMP family transporter [Neolewinella aquimaris]
MVIAAAAGYVFMEMTARITIVSEQTLGQILRSGGGSLVPVVTFLSVLFGCMAYQAGNLLGALGGLRLLLPADQWWLIPLAGAVVALLWSGSTARVGRVMTYVVSGMGLLFLVAAVRVALGGGVRSTTGAGVDPTVLFGLIGTTIVPYNFFLAAGLGSGSKLEDMRRGLGLSFGIGMVITAAILIVGSVAPVFVSFADLGDALENILGGYGKLALGAGLFAAGFSSAATAPLAAAVAGRELLGFDSGGWVFRGVWLSVLLTGLGVALLQLDIIGVIVIAQVINGLLLPFIALVVFVLANRRSLMGERVNRWWQNLLSGAVLLFIFYKAGEFLLGLL